jgi:hypothetical protein
LAFFGVEIPNGLFFSSPGVYAWVANAATVILLPLEGGLAWGKLGTAVEDLAEHADGKGGLA